MTTTFSTGTCCSTRSTTATGGCPWTFFEPEPLESFRKIIRRYELSDTTRRTCSWFWLAVGWGALILTELTTFLAGEGLDEGGTRILLGLAIIVVVFVYGRERRLRDRL